VILTGTDENGKTLPTGIGFVTAPGVIATSNDVVKDATTIHARLGNREMSADIFAVNLQRTVALLQLYDLAQNVRYSYTKAPVLALTNGGAVSSRELLYIVASGDAQTASVAAVKITDFVTIRGRQYPRIKTAVSSTSAGSPVVNEYGEVLGLVGVAEQKGKPVGYIVSAAIIGDADKPSKGTPDVLKGPLFQETRTIKPPAASGPVEVKPSDRQQAEEAEARTAIGGITKDDGVLRGMAIRRVEPTYPPLANAARVTGPVVVEVVIDEDGYVAWARAIWGHPLLKDSATAAAMGWKFAPTKLDGKPVNVLGTITFNFQR
jgi:TonB family protein